MLRIQQNGGIYFGNFIINLPIAKLNSANLKHYTVVDCYYLGVMEARVAVYKTAVKHHAYYSLNKWKLIWYDDHSPFV